MAELINTTVRVADMAHIPSNFTHAMSQTYQPTLIFSDSLFSALNLNADSPMELVQYADGRIELKPFVNNISRLKGIAKFDDGRVLSVEEMNEIIANAGAESDG